MIPKVLFIAGYPRSGSTLLLRLLTGAPGYAGVGELYDIWRRSFLHDQLCGCGERFSECPFWQPLVRKTLEQDPKREAARLEDLRRRVQSTRYLPRLLLPRLRPDQYRRRLENYADTLGCLYRAIQEESSAEVVVESSKLPSYALVLAEVPGIELHTVHLIRDSRATAFSWQRRKLRPEIHWRQQYMDRWSAAKTAYEWTAINGLLEATQRRSRSYTRIRYEDFVESPRAVAEDISRQIGVPRDFGEVVDEQGVVRLGIDHTVSGNPNRFQRGTATIALDDEWRTEMSWRQRALVTAGSFPLLLRYRYLGNSKVGAPTDAASATRSDGPQSPTREDCS